MSKWFRRYRYFRLPLVILLAGFCAAIFYNHHQQDQQTQLIQQQLASRLNQISEGVKNKVISYTYGVAGCGDGM